MAGKWVDIVVIILLAVAIWRGFHRGLIREVFSLFGVLLAVAIAFERYQELSLHLMVTCPLAEWQAEIIAFVVLALGIALMAFIFRYLWSRIIRFSPFALLDSCAGALFGFLKVLVVIAALVFFLSSLTIPLIDQVLAESFVVQQLELLWPPVQAWLEHVWPTDWAKPGWLFPYMEFESAHV